MCLANKQAFPIKCKLAVVLPYLGRCGTAEGIMLLGSFHFDSSQWAVLGFITRGDGGWCALGMTLDVCDDKSRGVRIVEAVDHV